MDSLADILANKDFAQPDEITAIKAYVANNYGKDVSVALQGNQIVISSRNASLISSLRLNAPALAAAALTTKKLRFRIG